MSIRLFNSAGGYIDLESGGNGSTANVFTLPAETGTILTSASSLAAASLTGNVASARIVSALNAEGSAPIYACRAWVNFNQQSTQTILGSGNVSSITDQGTGRTTINFATAMPDDDYAQVIGVGDYNVEFADRFALGIVGNSTKTTSNTLVHLATSTADRDYAEVNIAIFR